MKKIKINDNTKGLLVVFGIFFGIAFIYNHFKTKDLKNNGELVFITVNEITLDQYGRPGLHVVYEYNGDVYKESRSFANLSYNRCKKYLLDKKVGIVFSKSRPTNMEILLTPLSFSNVGLEMPDSSKVLFEKIRLPW